MRGLTYKHNKLFVTNRKVMGAILFGDISGMNKLRKAVIENINANEYLKYGIDFK